MAGNNINSVFYAESYHPIQAGSIDGTDVLPHDNAVFRAHLCSNAGLYDPLADAKAIGDPYRTVFVGRLSRLTTEQTLHKAMCRHGRIKDLRLVRDIVTGASRGYAFIEYETERDMRRAYREAHHSIIDDCEILVDYNRQRLMPGWIPRRLGGGLGGRKESGQLRFGGRERPFRAPLRPIPHEELKRLGIPPPPVGRYMPRFQVPSPPRRKRSSPDKEVCSEETSSIEREDHGKGSIDNEVNSNRNSSMKEHHHGKNSGDNLDHYRKTKYREKRDDHRRSSRDKEDSYEASIGESEEKYRKRSHRGKGEHGPRSKSSIDREECERSSSMESEEYRRRRKDDEVNSSIQRFMEEMPHRGRRLRKGSEFHRYSMGGDHYRRSSMDRESQYDASMSEREERHLKQGHRDKEERGHKRKRSSADWEEHSERSNFKEKEHRRVMDNESYSDRQRFTDEKHYHSRSLKEKSGLSRKDL